MSLRNYISFPIVYWLLFFVLIISVSYTDGKKRLSVYNFTNGVVVDKLLLPYGRKTRRDMEFAQWQYVAGRDTLLFVDKQAFTRNKPIGTNRRVIYLKNDPAKALVYSFQFWIDLPKIILLTLIAVFVFAVCLFAIHWKDKAWFNKLR